MKEASYLIRLGSKGLGKDVTMPLKNAIKSVHVTKQFYFPLGQASNARDTNVYDTTENKLQPERRVFLDVGMSQYEISEKCLYRMFWRMNDESGIY